MAPFKFIFNIWIFCLTSFGLPMKGLFIWGFLIIGVNVPCWHQRASPHCSRPSRIKTVHTALRRGGGSRGLINSDGESLSQFLDGVVYAAKICAEKK